MIISVGIALSLQVKMSNVFKVSNVFSWSDSKVALHWVKSAIEKWKILIENRVSEIRENVEVGVMYQLIVILQTLLQNITKKLKFVEVL